MEEIQKSLQLYKEQVKFYSDFVINLAKDYNELFDKYMELQKDIRELKGESPRLRPLWFPCLARKED